MHFSFYTLLFFSCLSGLTLVAGHGFVHEVDVGGQTYPGWNPSVDNYSGAVPGVVRKVASDGPVVDFTGANISCNVGGSDPGTKVAEVSSGSPITFDWSYWPSDHQGPVTTYMASCGGDCTTFNADNARWFKIDAMGYQDGQWAANKLITNNASWTSTIPAGLAPGQYLARHEIIALHSNPAQYYPSCSQLKVTGSGTGQPSDSDLVSMPDVYSNVQYPDIYTDSPAQMQAFVVPGPPIVTFDGTAPASNSPEPSLSSNSSSTATAATASSDNGTTMIPQTSYPTPMPSSAPSSSCSLGSRKLIRRRSLVKRH
ncbi:hypothetical protein BDN72DRAFT_768969 [Pluteus cervinus]|uniref:Uncharacterized protein n=1 Tax=Pluteus cervinus TaxID=181527 RepID=A0ACD3ARV7_9AGAR|nr:hypothetical protein BDN72DRAFT_768969 [Pluteus cervinus]